MINTEQLIKRVKHLVIQPNEAWVEIKDEKKESKELIIGYMLPLVLIPTVASFIGYGFIDAGRFFGASTVMWGLSKAVIAFAGAFLGVFISAWCIHKLAPSFNTQVTMTKALSLVIYAYTPSWLAGVFYLIPALSILGFLAGIYSLYILYTGFKPISNVSEEQKTNFFIVSLLVIIGVSIVLTFALGALFVTVGFAYY